MSERIFFSTYPEYQFYPPPHLQPPQRSRTPTIPVTPQTAPTFDYHKDPMKAASRIVELVFPHSRAPKTHSVQVYIFAMENHFLIMMSPGSLPFTPFTHTGDGLYQVNPIYQRPYFSYPVSAETYQAIMGEASGLEGIPPLLILKGAWNSTLLDARRCVGHTSDIIFGRTTSIQTPEFALHKIPNTWAGSDTLQGVAYSLGDKTFRIWFHEKNLQALTNAMGEKREEIKELKKLHTFLTEVPLYHRTWHAELFKKEEEIAKIGDWCHATAILIPGHPDKERVPDQRNSTHVQTLTSEFRKKTKEVKQNKKKPIERLQKEREREDTRQKLVAALKTSFDESMAWIHGSTLSLSPNFLRGSEGAIQTAEGELKALEKAEPLLGVAGKERELEDLRCPTSAFRTTMQIESSTEKASKRARAWVFIPTCINLVDWYLRSFDRHTDQKTPEVPVDFIERSIEFLMRKNVWVSQHGFSSHLDPRKFMNLVKYHTQSLQDLHDRLYELRKFFTNAPIPQQAAADYPYLFEEAGLWKEFREELEALLTAVSPDHTFQFYQETTKLKGELEKILAGGTIYKRVNAGGNVVFEFIEEGKRGQLNQSNLVHTPILI